MAWFKRSETHEGLDHLARSAQAGDREAMGRLYRELQPCVARYIARRVSSDADAEDLCARVFERVVRKLDNFDARRGCVEAWTIRIARNLVIDHFRARRPAAALSFGQQADDARRDPATQLLAVEELSELAQRVDACSPEIRQLLSLRFGDGLRHKAIAELLGSSESAVRKRLSRALKVLRREADVQSARRAEPPAAVDSARQSELREEAVEKKESTYVYRKA